MRLALAALTTVALAAAAVCPSARAAVITAQAVTDGNLPFTLENLGSAGSAGLVSATEIDSLGERIEFSGGPAEAGLFAGAQVGQRASPFDGTGLADANYLVVEPGGSVTISFAQAQTEFDLLWGTVDTYNHLSIGLGSLQVSGADIAAAAGGLQWGISNLAVRIADLPAFTSVTLTSDQPAFEFVPGIPVSEPGSLALLGAALLGLAPVWRRGASVRS